MLTTIKALTIAATTSITLSTNAVTLEHSCGCGCGSGDDEALQQEIHDLQEAIVDAAAAAKTQKTAAAASDKALAASAAALAASEQELTAAEQGLTAAEDSTKALTETLATAAAEAAEAARAHGAALTAAEEDSARLQREAQAAADKSLAALTEALDATELAASDRAALQKLLDKAVAEAETASQRGEADRQFLEQKMAFETQESSRALQAAKAALIAADSAEAQLQKDHDHAVASLNVLAELNPEASEYYGNILMWTKLQDHESQPCGNDWSENAVLGFASRHPCDWEKTFLTDANGLYYSNLGSDPRDAIYLSDAQNADFIIADISCMRPGGQNYKNGLNMSWSLIDKYGNIVAEAGKY